MHLKYLILIALFCPMLKTAAQTTNNLTYTNDQEEMVCIHSDTICFKLKNSDAFKTFSIGMGIGFFNKSGFCIKELLQASQLTASLVIKESGTSGVSLIVLDHKKKPIDFVTICLKDARSDKLYLRENCDREGMLTLTESQIQNLKNVEVRISIETVGFVTEKPIIIERGRNYIIESLISYPFRIGSRRDKLSIKAIADRDILQIRYNGSEKSLKREANNKCDLFHSSN